MLQEKKLRVYSKQSDPESTKAVSMAFERYVKARFGNEVIGTPCKKATSFELDHTIKEASRKRKLFQTIPEQTPVGNFA